MSMAASFARRSTFLHKICTNSSRFSVSSPSISSEVICFRTRISSLRCCSSSRFPRELSSLLPFHSAVASARFVSKLPDASNLLAECRFANYVSPI